MSFVPEGLLDQARAEERARVRKAIRKAQAPAIRVLRELAREEVDCAADWELPGCTARRHAQDCPRRIALEAIRGLSAATKEPR